MGSEEEYAPRTIEVTKAEYDFMPEVKIIVTDHTSNMHQSSDVLHLRLPEAAELYHALGDYLRGLEEI